MRKARLIPVCFVLILALCGCSNDQYAIEREYWKVKKQADSIFKNPAGIPPNELERVVKQLDDFVAKNPNNILAVESQFLVARLYAAKNEFEDSRKRFKSIMAKYSKSAVVCSEALFLIGQSYQAEDKWEFALEQYNKLIAGYPLTVRGMEAPVYIAQYYKVKFQPDKMLAAFGQAIDHYRSLAAKYPDSQLALRAYNLIAACYGATKDWQNSLSTLNTIIDKFKAQVKVDTVFWEMVLIYKKELKDDLKVKETVERLIKEYPDSKFIKPAKALLKK
ncbi:MAG: tetratricopeptide repeat protein [Candidatus Omnitrophica bacterium]|nr:tetratricopeptide repeat protein [Candidatus Omnitrophota bacterium]